MPAGLANLATARTWAPARHLRLLNQDLIDVAAGRCRRLLVCMPPRHGKSTLTSHYFPAWFLGRWPDKRVILASYEADFAAGWGRKARDVLTEYGPSLFGVSVREDSAAANRWDIAGRSGGMVTAGVGGPITGRGADLLLIDDPVKNAEEARSPTQRNKAWDWYLSTAYTRLEPGGAVVLIMTRWHADDLAGRVLKHARDDGGEPWRVRKLPAIAEDDDQLGRAPGEALWPERWPLDQLEAIRRTQSAYWWGTLYQQNEIPEGGAEWPEDFFRGIFFDDWSPDLRHRVLALDPSKGKSDSSGDYSAFVMLGLDRDWNLWADADLDRRPVERQRGEPGRSIVEDGLRIAAEWQPAAFSVETNGFQELVASAFLRVARERNLHLPLYGVCSTTPKDARIRTIGTYLAQRRLRVRNTPGGRLLVQQLRDFPEGEHDDGPDALAAAIRLMDYVISGRAAGGADTPQVYRG